MPLRGEKFYNGGMYHVFNKTIEHLQIFEDVEICNAFLDILVYYRSTKSKVRYSRYKRLAEKLKREIDISLNFPSFFRVEILSYCLMPNHFHLLLKQQKSDGGVVKFMSDVLNSFTRYYNIKRSRKGPIFLTQFKSKRMRSREQLIHVSRYIHLNPFSSEIVTSEVELLKYPFSSLREYIEEKSPYNISNKEIILNEFQSNRKKYRDFVMGNADYQKALEDIKHIRAWTE